MCKVGFLLLLTQIFTGSLAGQPATPLYPQQTITLDHLSAVLQLQQNGTLRGEIEYDFKVLPAGTDSVMLHASGLDILSATLNNEEVSFRFDKDALWIYPRQRLVSGTRSRLGIIYETRSSFGIHRNDNGTLFTSLLPASTRHWLPVVDGPLAEFTTDLRFTHPVSFTLVSNGEKVSNDVLSVDEAETRFRSEFPVAATDLFFLAGRLQTVTSGGDLFDLHAYYETDENDISRSRITDEEKALRADAIRIRLETEATAMRDLTGRDYPLGDYHIIHLRDIMWEPRRSAIGIQLAGIEESNPESFASVFASQWSLNLLRPHRASEPEANLLLKAFAEEELGLGTSDYDLYELPYYLPQTAEEKSTRCRETPVSYYHRFSPSEMIKAKNILNRDPLLRVGLKSVYADLFQVSFPLLTWADLGKKIYEETGISRVNMPPWVCPSYEAPQVLTYDVSVLPDETAGRVTVRFEARGESVKELRTVLVTEAGYDGKTVRELELTGPLSEWVLTVSPSTETLTFSMADESQSDVIKETRIILNEEKPLIYWIAQYDLFEEDARMRAEALVGLRSFSDNPDIQLALKDRLESEADSEVLAEGITTMASTTKGAKGTENFFLQYLSSDQPLSVQRSAARALSSYQENQEVLRRLRVTVQRSEDALLRDEALQSMAAITTTELFNNSTERFLTDERMIFSVPQILKYWSEKGATEQALEMASTYLSSVVPYDVRIALLEWMLSESEDPGFWEPKLPSLLRNGDPRIRALAIPALTYVNPQMAKEWAEMIRSEEFDDRVRDQLELLDL